jgi:hypothetical protein
VLPESLSNFLTAVRPTLEGHSGKNLEFGS